jgi:hypothetical protein
MLKERVMTIVVKPVVASSFAAVLIVFGVGFTFAQAPGTKLYIPAPAPTQTLVDGTKVVNTTAPAFNLVLQGEIFRAQLPFTIVSDASQADYVVEWAAIPEEGNVSGNGSVLFHNVSKELYTVSVSLLGRDKQVVWAGSADKRNLRDCALIITQQLKTSMKHKK